MTPHANAGDIPLAGVVRVGHDRTAAPGLGSTAIDDEDDEHGGAVRSTRERVTVSVTGSRRRSFRCGSGFRSRCGGRSTDAGANPNGIQLSAQRVHAGRQHGQLRQELCTTKGGKLFTTVEEPANSELGSAPRCCAGRGIVRPTSFGRVLDEVEGASLRSFRERRPGGGGAS